MLKFSYVNAAYKVFDNFSHFCHFLQKWNFLQSYYAHFSILKHKVLRKNKKGNKSMRNCNAQNRMNPVCPNESNRDMGPEFVVAMAYVPWQQFGPLYDIEKGLMVGTIFPELDKPFLGRRAFRR